MMWLFMFLVAFLMSLLILLARTDRISGRLAGFLIFVLGLLAIVITFYTGIPTCPQCEQWVNMDDVYCPKCGYELAETCADCGNQIEENNKFCDKCGAEIKE